MAEGTEVKKAAAPVQFKAKEEGYCRVCGERRVLNGTGFCEEHWLARVKEQSQTTTPKAGTKIFLTKKGYRDAYIDADDDGDKAQILDSLMDELFPEAPAAD